MGIPMLAIDLVDPACAPRAERLAARLSAPVVSGAAPDEGALLLRVDARGLSLAGEGMELRPDFADCMARLKPANLGRELLVRAVRVKGVPAPHVVDATAGLGDDALLLAAAGCRVTMFERDPVIAALLDDALARAREDPRLAGIAARMELAEGDSVTGLRSLAEPPDVVYLDPMFPGRTKSAAVKKKFQLLHRLERPCGDEGALMDAARAARPRKIVVKRPAKGPYLAGVKPSHSLAGKAVRFDCIACPR